MDALFSVLCVAVALVILAQVRNELSYRHRIRRIDEIAASRRNVVAALDAMPSYYSQFFDLRIWTYRQFFPEAA
jgi:hypothetical protein